MPRVSAIRTPAVEHLAVQLRFAPPEALLRAVERIEELAGEVEPEREYPAEWLIFRVTGYRPEEAPPGLVRGGALLADLSSLAERLSQGAGQSVASARGAGMLGVPDLCARWRVSRKTIDRLRRRGLIARRVLDRRRRASLVFSPGAVHRFESAHAPELENAGSFSRIDPDTEERIVRRAARYRRLFGWSLSTAAARLAKRFGRSHETVRLLLLRQGRALDFPGRPRVPASLGQSALIEVLRGVEPREIAKRRGVARAGATRVLLLARRALLRELVERGELATGHSPTFDHPDAEEVILSPAPVRSGLGAPGTTDLLEFLRDARGKPQAAPARDLTRALAYQYLRSRAARLIASLDSAHPSATVADRAETMLRWGARLKRELMRPQLHLVVDTLEGLLKGPPEELPQGLSAARLADLVRAALAALADAADQFEPQRPALVPAGRFAAPASLAITRACTRWLKAHGVGEPGRAAKRAAGRVTPGVTIEDWTLGVAPWQEWLEPDARVRAGLASVAAKERDLLSARFGWGGEPRTLAELARSLKTTHIRAALRERAAIRAALGASPKPAKEIAL